MSLLPFVTAARRSGRRLLPVLVCCGAVRAPAPRGSAAESYDDLPARRLTPGQVERVAGQDLVERENRRQQVLSERWHQVHELIGPRHVSAKSRRLLSERGLGLDRPLSAPDKALTGTDTLRVLLVRISFETNRDPHLTTIAPDGDFVLEPLADPAPIEIDPPPRNKAFFESHLTGLSEYYRFMSGGRLHIEGQVLPEGDNDSYKLSDVADYGPGADDFWSLESLEAMVRDMIDVTDQGTAADGSVNLADYDDNDLFTYIIFVHAGSDWQSDINQDSPNDIPTFFVTLGEPQPLGSVGSDGAPGALSECSVIPETTNQDGYPGSIAAAFYHEFGHALGLPDVYSTRTGYTSVGVWDLMDSGTNLAATVGDIVDDELVVVLATGVLPPSISAWNKWYLGWLEMDEIDGRAREYQLPAVGVPRDDYWFWRAGFGAFDDAYPQAWRAGVSPREWFLLENRFVPEGVDETPFDGLAFERDEDTGVILYLAGLRGGVWENSGLYDFFMPAGGVLVWHVNEDRIEAELPTNTINYYGDGLRLVEADGIQDIGVIDAYVLGWYGSGFDPFGGYAFDQTGGRVENDLRTLHVEGFPSSRMFDRSWSGLSLSDVASRSLITPSVMEFRAALEPLAPGFPWQVDDFAGGPEGSPFGAAGPRAVAERSLTPLTIGGAQVLVFMDDPGENLGEGLFTTYLYGIRADGGVWFPPQSEDWPSHAFAAIGGQRMVGAPCALPREAGGHQFVFGTDGGVVMSYLLPESAAPSLQWTRGLGGGGLWTAPVALRDFAGEVRLLTVLDDNTARLLDLDGQFVGDPLALPSDGLGEDLEVRGLAVLPDAGGDAALLLAQDGLRVLALKDGGLDGSEVYAAYRRDPVAGPLWPAVLPHDGGLRVRVFDSEGELGAWDLAPGDAPVAVAGSLDLPHGVAAEPAVADVDGDGRDDLIILSSRRVEGFLAGGQRLRGFPRPLADMFPLDEGTAISGPLVVADATGDGVNEIFFQTDGGHLLGLDAEGNVLPRLPLRWGDARASGFAVGGEGADRLLWLASRGGYTGPPFDRQWIGGRVAAYGMTGGVDGTSEWRGAAGGVLRRGAEGIAQDLGDRSSAAVDRDAVVIYPNPLQDETLTVRYHAAAAGTTRLAVYNLEGEVVATAEYQAGADMQNEHSLSLPGVASGLYLVRLQYPGAGGAETRTLTLAVER